MIVIKPKMLKGKLNIKNDKNYLYTAGLILGALGNKIDVVFDSEFKIDKQQNYLMEILNESGCQLDIRDDILSVLCTGITNPVLVDAKKCGQDIFFVISFLCFLKGYSKIINIKSIPNPLKERIFLLLGSLKKLGADISVESDEILFVGRQTLDGAEVSAYSDFNIFTALCIVAHRCEGSLNIVDILGIKSTQYEDFKNMLITLGSDIDEKNSFFKMRKNIVLTGMSGAGKSYIGKAVADKLGLKFYDSDDEFEKEENREIIDVFKENGEEYFRKRECEIIKKLSRKNGCVIATGGGAVLSEENVLNLKDNGIVIYLKRDIDTIINTVSRSNRPLFKGGKTAIRKLFKDRKEVYENTSDYTVCNNSNMDKAVECICEIYEKCKDVLK